jgi:hypothetical protein
MTIAARATALLSIWNTRDLAARNALIEACVSEQVLYLDPHIPRPVTNRTEFGAFISTFQERVTGVEVVTGDIIQEHNDHARIAFTIKRSDAIFSRGTFFTQSDDEGRFTKIVGFVD